MNATKLHDLFSFMSQISTEMAEEYERIRIRASEDPGTAGDQGEENWATLLRGWLPPTYNVVTKGRLIGHDGTTSPQVDVLVLKPCYPSRLFDKKYYLAGGVAAAFERKLTLEAAHVRKAVEAAVAVKSLFRAREGSPYRELHAPIIYGLLAHSHSWKAQGSTPLSNIEAHLWAADAEKVSHPRYGLDCLCVADLATWIASAITFIGPAVYPGAWETAAPFYGPEGSATTSYIGHNRTSNDQSAQFTPIGVLISYLIQKLGWEDWGCRDLADYYRLANLAGPGRGQRQRLWPATIYSDGIRERVVRGMLSNGVAWDEWSVAFL